MSLEGLTAKDLIDPAWFPTYQLQVNVLWQQLVQLNSNIQMIEKIEQFPFHLFNTDKNAWQMIKNALIESTVLLTWRIVYDDDKKVLTLKKLKVGTQKHIHESFKSS